VVAAILIAVGDEACISINRPYRREDSTFIEIGGRLLKSRVVDFPGTG